MSSQNTEGRAGRLAQLQSYLRRRYESLFGEAGDENLNTQPTLQLGPAGLSPGTELGPYIIEEKLGEGGMGQVYRAKDTRLDRQVAIKISEERFSDRFSREAKLIAALNHPHICTLFDVGPNFLVMELIQGPPLSQLLKRGPMPLEQALTLAGQIADALRAAHSKGVIHRDIKPANIAITEEGRIKLVDFGLARQEGGPMGANPVTLTQPGAVIGTPAYMSPEQVRGQRADQRTDVWSFGCVLFEILSGVRAFGGKTLVDCATAVLDREPNWDALPPEVPANVRAVIGRCLDKNPETRIKEFAEICEAISGAVLPAAPAVSDATRTVGSLAVLPFANSSGDSEMEYLGDGLTESLTFALSQSPQVRVMSRSAVARYRHSPQPPQEIGRRLGVAAVLTGTVQQRGSTLIVSAELVDSATGFQIWGSQYRKASAEIFALEEQLTREISEKLRLKLEPESTLRRHTEDAEAYHLYLKGVFHWAKRTEEGLKRGIQHFRQALEVDPTYALAWAGLAEGYTPLAIYGHVHPREAWPKARSAADRALAIDPNNVEARSALAGFAAYYEGDLILAEREIEAVLAINPNYPRAYQWRAEYLNMAGKFGEAEKSARRALSLDPLSLSLNSFLTMTFYFARRFPEAIEEGRKCLELDDNFYPAHFYLGLALQQAGQHEAAVHEFRRAAEISNRSTLMLAALAGELAVSGNQDEARSILTELEGGGRYVSQIFMAAAWMGLGERDKAIAALERGKKDRCPWRQYLMVDPRFDELRKQGGFSVGARL